MIMELKLDELKALVSNQIKNLFHFSFDTEYEKLKEGIHLSLLKTENCFSQTSNKYYKKNDTIYFNPFHSGQYSIFLYFLSRQIYLLDVANTTLADRIYYLNKALNGLDLFYEVEMPDVFYLDHPVGTVIGRAKIDNYFSFAQGCTVGGNKGVYPKIGENVKMFSDAKVIGDTNIGKNVWISANTYIKDSNIPEQSIVFGSSPNLIIKNRPIEFFLTSAN